jgi:hypothetical protein
MPQDQSDLPVGEARQAGVVFGPAGTGADQAGEHDDADGADQDMNHWTSQACDCGSL